MNTSFINVMKWQLCRLYERFSKLGLLAIALSLLILLWFVLACLPLSATLTRLQLDAQMKQKMTPAVLPVDEVQAFQSQFPNLALRASKVDQLMQIIAQQGLQVDEVRYQSDANASASLSRYRVTFNTQATYPNVHRLLNTVLVDMPFVALNKFALRRESVSDEMVDVELSVDFYFKKS